MAGVVVGRSGELERVEALLDGGPDGLRALVLDGEAGIGKTTIWRSGVEAARANGYTVLRPRRIRASRAVRSSASAGP